MGRKSKYLYDSSCFRRVRTGTHAFYEARGCMRGKCQLNFKKIIRKHEEQAFGMLEGMKQSPDT